MAKAIAAGIPKLRIEEAAARTQARIDSGRQTIVGVNKYRVDGRRPRSTSSRSTTAPCASQQIAKLNGCAASAIQSAVESALNALTEGAQRQRQPARSRGRRRRVPRRPSARSPTRMEKVFAPPSGRYPRHLPASTERGSGDEPTSVDACQQLVEAFEKNDGRRPRILIAKMGQDGHDRGQKVIASAFADLGFDVDIGPLFATPDEAARQAVENDVHVVGVSSLAAGHLTLVPELKAALDKAGPRRHHDRRRRRHPAVRL